MLKLNITAKKYNLIIPETKMQLMAFKWRNNIEVKIIINGKIIGHVKRFNFLG